MYNAQSWLTYREHNMISTFTSTGWDENGKYLTSQCVSFFPSHGLRGLRTEGLLLSSKYFINSNHTSVRVRSAEPLGFSLPAFWCCGKWMLNIYLTLMIPARDFLLQMWFLLYSVVSATCNHLSDVEHKKLFNLDYCYSPFL